MEIVMKNKKSKTLPAVILLTLLTTSYSYVTNAESLDKKLQQCKQEFSISHQSDASQKVATAARLKHLKLMKEILHELNMKNADQKLSNAEMQENVMVMSHLLEMLVTENLSEKDQSWNLNY